MRTNKNDSDHDVDALFRLPLAEFTNARNGLAAHLKKKGRAQDASDVKALGKPSVSAWAVNQLYWNHRDVFDKLIMSGERFHKAQKSGKMSEMRAALDTRREALTQLSNVAASLLKEAGHNPSPDTIHRITTTLEGISAYASRDDGPQPGRLTHDVDPPGFASVGSFVPAKSGAAGRRQETGGRSRGQKAGGGSKQRADDGGKRKDEEASEKKIAAVKASLQEAKKLLAQAHTRVRSLEAARTRSHADMRQAEERFKEATKRARTVDEDLKDAERELKDAERRVAKATAPDLG